MILAAEIETEQLCEKWRLICHRRHLMASQTLILPHLRIACQPTVVVTSLYHNVVKPFLKKNSSIKDGGDSKECTKKRSNVQNFSHLPT